MVRTGQVNFSGRPTFCFDLAHDRDLDFRKSRPDSLRGTTSMIPRITHWLRSFWQEETGATAVEYALMLALIMVSCISAILSTGDVQKVLWFDTSDTMKVILK